MSKALLHGHATGRGHTSAKGAAPPHTACDLPLLQGRNQLAMAAETQQRQEQQHGHTLSPERQGPQQFDQAQHHDGNPEGYAAHRGNDRYDKGRKRTRITIR